MNRVVSALALVCLQSACLAPAVAATPDRNIHRKAEESRAPALAMLERLVNTDSGTNEQPGIDQVTDLVMAELGKLQVTVETFPATPNAGRNVVARLKGKGKGRILLIAHLDTVFAAGTARQRPFRIEAGRARGPGVADDKGGVVVGLFALRMLRELNYTDYATITLLLNPNEETGSVGSRELITSLAREHDFVLNLEPGRAADGLVIARKGSAEVEVQVRGKASHAGNAPEQGRNAAMELAHQMLQLAQLGDASKQTTVNFTVVKSGDRTNVIPDQAMARADVRVVIPAELDRLEADLARVSQRKLIPDTEVKVVLNRGFPPFPRNAATDALAARAQRIYGELDRKLTLEEAGGAADSSLTAGAGAVSLDGLGMVGGNFHAEDEYVEVESLVPRLYLLTRLLMELGARP
jgi:glutamate carboxypeptidase